jgi:hypothetical protein
MSNDPKIQRLQRGINEQQQRQATLEKKAVESITDFIIDLIRPFVKGLVAGLFGWLQKLFK